MTCSRVLDWMIEYSDTLYIQLVTTRSSAIADLHTLQIFVTHALEPSVFANRILATDFSTEVIPVSL
jgi:hypothetical protein